MTSNGSVTYTYDAENRLTTTPGQKILDSDNPAIKGFLDNMKTVDGMTGRQALEKALAGDGEAAGQFLSDGIGELVDGGAEVE